MDTNDRHPHLPSRVTLIAQVAAVGTGLAAGYAFGVRISGELLGVLLAANAAVFCSMMVDTLADLALRLQGRQGPTN